MGAVFLVIFTLSAVFQILYHLYVFGQLWLHEDKVAIDRSKSKKWPAVSVIIAARNEADNLKRYLPHWADQDYPGDWELIIVNDRSTDESHEILQEASIKHFNIKYIHIKENFNNKFPGKKTALDRAIKEAKFDRLVFTDADCLPGSSHWIRLIIQQCVEEDTIVLGIGQYAKKKYVLNFFIQFETFLTALQYLSHALLGKPYMGVGRNLSYSKKSYLEANGFEEHLDVLSGDDDLFINKIGKMTSSKILTQFEAQTFSEPPKTWGDWRRQKQRHYSTAKRYRLKDQLILGCYALTHFLFYISLLVILLTGFGLKFALLLATQKLIVQLLNFSTIRRSLQFPAHYPVWLMDMLFVYYYAVHASSVLTSAKRKWNGD